MVEKVIRMILVLIIAAIFITPAFSQEGGGGGGYSQVAGGPSYDFTKEGYGEVFIENYPLGPGDSLSIRVFTLDPFEEKVIVSQDGKLILPTIGEVSVSGTTIPKLRELLTKLYSEYYTDFTISIELVEVKKIQIYVFGNVSYPGIYTVYANTTLLEFLQKTGLTSTAKNRRLIHYREDVKTEIDPFRLSVLGEIVEQNMYLHFGDKIEVLIPEKSIELAGKVYRPGVYEVLPGESLRDILVLAGGPDPFADISDAVVERPLPTGASERIHIDLTNVWQGNQIFEVKNRDRLYVPFKEYNIYILGAVGLPGSYPFIEGKGVEQYLAEAGGYLKDAHLSFVTVIRPGPRYGNRVVEKFQINLKEVLKEKFTKESDRSAFRETRVILEPGDVIMVPYKGTEEKHTNLNTILTVLQNIFSSILVFKK